MEDAEGIGIDPTIMLEAIRTEYADWSTYLDKMGKVQQLLLASGCATRLDMLIMVDDPISTEEQRANLEKDQGYLAFVLGRHIRDCPYPPSAPAATSWRQGYLDAKDDHAQDN